MPSANGVYSLPTGYLAVTGATIQASQHNPPLEDIAAALTLRLSRDGSAPMTGPLQLASGTVTVPGAVFAADATSGFYKTTAGIGVAVGGVKVAEFLPGGVSGARFLGELIPFTGSTCPALCVFPAGQTLSRTTYAALWTFVQLEITAGSLLWNNGDGSTTFGIPDLRGRVPVCNDGLGGTGTANRTTNGTMTPSGTQNGSVGGIQLTSLAMGNLPASPAPVAASTSGYTPITSPGFTALAVTNGAPGNGVANGGIANVFLTSSYAPIQGFTSLSVSGNTAALGSGTAFTNMPPSIITSYILFAGA